MAAEPGARRHLAHAAMVACIAVTFDAAASAVTAAAVGTEWFQMRSRVDTASVCLTRSAANGARARVTVVDRRGHICDVAGSVVAEGGAGLMRLQADPPGACELLLDRSAKSLRVTDRDGACRPLWCGEGVAFGSRKVTRQATPVRPSCEEP